jgi:CRISPR/Cas system-associated exonuclease Cas4 (RecB family)
MAYHRSVSQVKLFRSCPELFYWERIKGSPYVPSAASIQGSALHSAYASWEASGRSIDVVKEYQRCYADGIIKDSQRMPLASWKVWGRGRGVGEDIEIRRELGAQQVLTLTERAVAEQNLWRPAEMPDGSQAVEVPFMFNLRGIQIKGAVDLVREMHDGTLVVRDIKSGGRESTPLQLGVYKLALESIARFDIAGGDFYYAKDDTESPMFSLNQFSEEYLWRQFRVIDETIKNDLWVARPSSDCFNCSVKRKCREFN